MARAIFNYFLIKHMFDQAAQTLDFSFIYAVFPDF